MAAHRSAFIPAGIVLVLLGLGNWITGHVRVVEHEQLLASSSLPARMQEYEEFSQLTARTNATLLRPLQAKSDNRTALVDKLDFYRVVESGGRLVTLFGLFMVLAAMIVRWYRGRPGSLANAALSNRES